jgi:integrase
VPIGIHDASRLPKFGRDQRQLLIGSPAHIHLNVEQINPASDMEKNLPKKRKKDRVLSLDEARTVWRAAGSAGYAFGTHVQLMLLTGCRAGE